MNLDQVGNKIIIFTVHKANQTKRSYYSHNKTHYLHSIRLQCKIYILLRFFGMWWTWTVKSATQEVCYEYLFRVFYLIRITDACKINLVIFDVSKKKKKKKKELIFRLLNFVGMNASIPFCYN